MAFYHTRVTSGGSFIAPRDMTLVRFITTMDLTSGNAAYVSRGPSASNDADPNVLCGCPNPGTAAANGGVTQVVSVEVGAPILQKQSVFCYGDNPFHLIFS